MINLTTALLSELKQYSVDNDITVQGDRRKKSSYINSIQVWMNARAYTGSIKSCLTHDKPWKCVPQIDRGRRKSIEKASIEPPPMTRSFMLVSFVVACCWCSVRISLAGITLFRWLTSK